MYGLSVISEPEPGSPFLRKISDLQGVFDAVPIRPYTGVSENRGP